MKFSAAAVLAAAAGASAFENVTYTTEVVTALTTFCPAATVSLPRSLCLGVFQKVSL